MGQRGNDTQQRATGWNWTCGCCSQDTACTWGAHSTNKPPGCLIVQTFNLKPSCNLSHTLLSEQESAHICTQLWFVGIVCICIVLYWCIAASQSCSCCCRLFVSFKICLTREILLSNWQLPKITQSATVDHWAAPPQPSAEKLSLCAPVFTYLFVPCYFI